MKRGPALAVLLLALGVSGRAAAFCRTHDCNPFTQTCDTDAAGCVTSGEPLAWPTLCVSFSVQEAGSSKYQLSAADFQSHVQTAFDQWTAAICSTDSDTPSIQVVAGEPVECEQVEYNTNGGNANVWMIRDVVWPYVGGEDALGLTTVHFDPDAKIIQDVDVEINATDTPLGIGGAPTSEQADLDSILTHEAGHFLGLAHTEVAGATMLAGYTLGDTSVRSLEPDDMDGICAVYPSSGRTIESDTTCTPRHGFASECGGASVVAKAARVGEKPRGCALARIEPSRANGGVFGWALLAGAVAVAARRRRARAAG